jgi:hypothetical protein
VNENDLKKFLDQNWQDNYDSLLTALGRNPKAITEASDCRTFVFQDKEKARAACEDLNKIPAVAATQNDKKVSTVQPETKTDQVVAKAKKHGGKMKGFQLSWL